MGRWSDWGASPCETVRLIWAQPPLGDQAPVLRGGRKIHWGTGPREEKVTVLSELGRLLTLEGDLQCYNTGGRIALGRPNPIGIVFQSRSRWFRYDMWPLVVGEAHSLMK